MKIDQTLRLQRSGLQRTRNRIRRNRTRAYKLGNGSHGNMGSQREKGLVNSLCYYDYDINKERVRVLKGRLNLDFWF